MRWPGWRRAALPRCPLLIELAAAVSGLCGFDGRISASGIGRRPAALRPPPPPRAADTGCDHGRHWNALCLFSHLPCHFPELYIPALQVHGFRREDRRH